MSNRKANRERVKIAQAKARQERHLKRFPADAEGKLAKARAKAWGESLMRKQLEDRV